MKILKQGNLQKSKKAKRRSESIRAFICPDCDCQFITDKTDYKEAVQVDCSGNSVELCCRCPYCDSIVNSFKK